MSSVAKELIEYYKEEISELREEGLLFAKLYPDVAKAINFSNSESGDPQVERLLESVAFIAARIKRQNNVLMSDAARLLLDCIYKDLLGIIPSMGFVQFQISPDTANSFGHSYLARGENILIKNADGNDYIFSTTCACTVSPMEIIGVSYVDGEDFGLVAKKYLHVIFKWLGDSNADKKGRIRFFISGANKYSLWDKIITQEDNVYLLPDNGLLTKSRPVAPVGFGEKETVFLDKNAFPGFRALMEYMLFPEKFLGFTVDINTNFGNHLDVYIPIADSNTKVSANNILINTVPVINLYKTTAEPMFFDPKVTEQMIIANTSSFKTERIHRIDTVYRIDSQNNNFVEIPNYFDLDKNFFSGKKNVYWQEKKKRNSVGEENSYISFINIDFLNPQITEEDVFHCEVICSNKQPRGKINIFSELTIEKALPLSQIVLVQNLTNEVNLEIDDQYLWKLISLLSLNSMTLRGNKDLQTIKKIIGFFSQILQIENSKENLSGAIMDLNIRNETRHISKDAWRGFVQGYVVDVQIDKKNCNSPILFGAILEKIFANFVHMDAFIDVNVIAKGGVIKRWISESGMIPVI